MRQAALEVFDAVAGEGFDAGGVVEDFDGDPAAIVDFGEGLEDGDEVELAHAGAAHVGVVGVEVVHELGVFADELRDRLGFAGHGLAVEVQAAVRRADHFAKLPAGLGGEQEVAVFGPERLDGQRDAAFFQRRHRAAQAIGGELHRLVVRDARQQIPLQRRAEDHEVPAQIAAEAGELADVVGRLFADGVVGRREVVAGRFGEQPVQADDLQVRVVGLLADFGPLFAAKCRRRSC